MNTNYNSNSDELKTLFSGSDSIEKNFSQAYQDLFALTMLGGKINGKYLEIGANDPFFFNNTALLESLGWKGISLEINSDLVEKFNNERTQKCHEHDATTFNWKEILTKKRWKTRIDYVSCDCEPASTTYKALVNLPHKDYRFSVITYETDVYKDGPEPREMQRNFLENLGYQLVCSNVCNSGAPFEDWWIDPKVIPESIWKPFQCDMTEARSIFIK